MAAIPNFGNRQNVFFIRPTEPDSPREGDLWFDNTNGSEGWFLFDGTEWNPMVNLSTRVGTSAPPTISTSMNGAVYECAVSADVTTWDAPIPVGGDASLHEYRCRVEFLPPDAGGPFTVAISSGWLQLGGLASISLSAGDEPIVVYLSTLSDGRVCFVAEQGTPAP